MGLTAADIRETTFAPGGLLRRGYHCEQVDAFLEEIARTLEGRAALTAGNVADVVFARSPLGNRGYNEDEVDVFLDRVQQALPGRVDREDSVDEQQLPLIVGLGNPGASYAGNRHNVGFMVLDELASRVGGKFKSHKSSAEVVEGRLSNQRAVLAKPRSYMNLSGGAVAGAVRFFKIQPASVIVVHDELDLPFGTVRMKLGGGDNGHNGLRSITSSLSTKDYLRVRCGIGRPPGRMDPAAFVLRDFSTVERKELAFFVDHCADAVEALMTEGLEAAQNRFHQR
ncbi:aminoacyl-tRNA hydrolase [Actinoalloteichus hymeniacidonis]|uniref:Peptidyl-tRNA hydrolase n=1 Tax=Actinoalloteichus hymeniacidonis TaxID=340345 RepID=A0AAC9HLR8_9PSEU|nr:aminoacyl-tRNA hydrolase [Actinoalloteichus hymeniacidonis]